MSSVLSSVLAPIGAFLRWWGGELAAMLPARLRRAGERAREGLVLDIAPSEAALRRVGKAPAVLGRVELAADGTALPEAGLRRVLDRRAREESVALRLPAALALRKTITLPAAAAENLRQVLTYELDRLTPFRRDEVVFDQRIVERDAAGRILVELTLVPKAQVDRALRVAASLGLGAEVVEVAAEREGEPPSGNLLAGTRVEGRGRPLTAAAALLAAAVLAAVAVWLPLQRQSELAAALAQQVAEARKQAAAAAKIEREIEALAREQTFVLARKQKSYAAVDVLNELTRLLPDDTHLSQWSLNGNQLQIGGLASSASNVIALLEQSPLFEKAQFRSPVTQDPRLGRERFQVSGEVVARPAP